MHLSLNETKPDVEKTIRELTALYDDAYRHQGGHVTLRTLPPSDVDYYERIDLTAFDFTSSRGIDRYVDVLCTELEASLRARRDLDDNMVPSVSPVLGIGDYVAFVGGDIVFQPDTSWSQPLLDRVDGYKALPPLGTAVWYTRFLDICERILQRFAGTGIPFMRGFFSPLDLANALRGDDLYLDFYDDPDALRGLLDYCATAIITFAGDIYALARRYLGDTPYGMWWLDGNINMSEDIACMISGELYREFCAPHTQRVINHFGRGHMHCHSRAMYLVREICALDNVVHLWLATDPNQPRPIDHIPELVNDARGVCLAIDCEDFSEIEANYGELKKGNFSICLPTRDMEEARQVIRRFRALEQQA